MLINFNQVQESSDSCDSETTVTSHPSQDVVTPLALDQPAFDLPDGIPKEAVLGGSQDEEQIKSGDRTHAEPEPQITQSLSAVDQELHTQNQPALKQDPHHTQHLPESSTDTELPTEVVNAEDGAQEEHASLDDSGSLYPPVSSSPVLCALKRAQQNQLSRLGQWIEPKSSDAAEFPGRGRGRRRGGIPLQRSSSLPSSVISPSSVVSSVRIQFGRGRTSCSQPRYSFRYSREAGGEKEAEEEETEGQTSSLSTLVINPPSSSGINNQPKLPMEAPVRTKPIPRPLMRSSCSLQSSSPPPDLSLRGHSQSWTTQSFPDLSSIQQPVGPYQQNTSTNRIQQSLNPRQMMFRNPNPTPPYLSPSPSPSLNHNPYPMLQNPPLQYPSPLQPYASLPNLFHYNNPSLQKRRSLNVFRSQMMDLELSIMQQQALVYRHLSPAERLEVEQLQSLRSAVRQELQELEQQLEDRLMEMTHQSKYRVYTMHTARDRLLKLSCRFVIQINIVLKSSLFLAAQVSDLLREQFFLQSEITYDGRASSSRRSSCSSSLVREEGGDGEQRPSMYRASINITPTPPPRPKIHTEEEEEEEEEGEKDEGGVKIPEVEGAVGNIKVENLQQLIRQVIVSLFYSKRT
uniref:Sperm-specific antigen 2 C-terminal domain-containing protein n=1 Tax=Mola mola TaxID=94237 RepID=A0A3Q3XNE9_MOLML